MDVPRESDNFTSDGSLSWVDLVSKPISITVDILARISAASVDTYSLTVALILAQRFQLGENGRQRVSEAIARLQRVSSWGNVISLGFGVENVVRVLDRTDEGNCTVALIAALAECFDQRHVANTLYEMIVLLGPPKDKRPSVSQWLALAKVCSGIFSTTTFPKIAEFYMQFDKKVNVRKYAGVHGPGKDFRGWASPQSLAETLLALASVSKGELKSIEVRGNGSAGWVAAVADWLFDLKVIICRNDGHVLFKNCANIIDGQVRVRLEDKGTPQQARVRFTNPNPIPLGGPSKPLEAARSTELMIASRTFYLKDISLLMSTPQGENNYFHVSGRVEWASCLMATFGKDFSDLMEMKQFLGKAIGCAARFMKCCIDCDPSIADEDYLTQCLQLYSGESSGIGLVEVIVKYFQEIADVKIQIMNMQEIDTAEQAAAEYEVHIGFLRRLCGCAFCNPEDEHVHMEQVFEDRESLENLRKKYRSYCYVTMVETIVVLAQILSNTDIVGDLLPSRTGIEWAYDRQLSLTQKGRSATVNASELNLLSKNFGCIANTVSPVVARSQGFTRLTQCLSLFTRGSIRRNCGEHLSAISEGGICVFMNCLRNPVTNQEETYRITVIPGRIEKDGKLHDLITDHGQRDEVDLQVYDATQTSEIMERASRTSTVTLKIKEDLEFLEAAFELQDVSGEAWFDFGPAMLNIMTSQARGKVSCQRRQCRTLSVEWIKTPNDVYHTTLPGERKVIWYSPRNEIERCSLITAGDILRTEDVETGFFDSPEGPLLEHPTDPYETILQGRTCLHCCLRYALTIDSLEFLIIAESRSQPPS